MTTSDATSWQHDPSSSMDVVHLRPQPVRAAVGVVLSAVAMLAAIAFLRAAATGWSVIDDGRPGNTVVTRLIGLVLGLIALVTAVAFFGTAARIRLARRVVVGPDAVELVAPVEPDRPVRLPRGVLRRVTVHTAMRSTPRLLPVPAFLRLELSVPPVGDAVYELLETGPGIVEYPLDGFDVPAVARALGVPVEVRVPTRPTR